MARLVPTTAIRGQASVPDNLIRPTASLQRGDDEVLSRAVRFLNGNDASARDELDSTFALLHPSLTHRVTISDTYSSSGP